MTNSTTVIIGGDLGPTKSNYDQFISGNIYEVIDKQALTLLGSVDYRIFNLEVPLTDNLSPISKDGPSLSAPSATIHGIKTLNPSLVTLANNHIMDHGESGLTDTMSHLSKNKIGFVGAGMTLQEASSPAILANKRHKIGIYACAEHEFSIAGITKAGANPFDPLESFDHINALKQECNYLIILYHGGKERYRLPTPELQKVCRKMISRGADLVICQHSHCVGSFEKYENGTIVYGQGNFLFDRHDDEFYRTGLLIKVVIGPVVEIEYLPICKRENGVELADAKSGAKILAGFYKRSEKIIDPLFVEKEFENYCKMNGQYYLATLAGFGKTLRRIDKVLNRPFTRLIYSESKLNTVRNHIECETHREIVLKYIEILNRAKKR